MNTNTLTSTSPGAYFAGDAALASSLPARPSVLPSSPRGVSSSDSARIMMIDDEVLNTMAVQTHLELAGFKNFAMSTDDSQALKQIIMEQPDVLLLDIMMPHVNGLDILQALRELDNFTAMPIIILTSIDDRQTKSLALEMGATDFLTKPVDPTELIPRVRNAVAIKEHHDHLHRYAEELERQVQIRTREVAASRLEVIHCLARAAEYRDNDTGRHVIRVGRFAGIIARGLGLDRATVELIEHAAPLHDVGKIGIPDAILLKPGRLTPEEFEIIQRHCNYGSGIIGGGSCPDWKSLATAKYTETSWQDAVRSPLLEMAAVIALTHHEKWDGSGYPRGLVGEQIPLPGRITAAADVFDALGSKRPYKEPFPVDRCFEILEEGRGRHFDPRVLDAFFVRRDEVLEVRSQLADPE